MDTHDLLLMFSIQVAIEQSELTEGLACTSPCAGPTGVGLYKGTLSLS